MAGVNKAILVGNLGKDPQLDYTTSGVARCRFSIATSEQYNDREGQRQERTEWHNIVCWNKLAEIAGEYLKKGRQVYIEGSIRSRQYQDQNGQTRYITEIIAQQMQMLGGPGSGGRGGEAPPPGEPEETGAPGPRRQSSRGSQPPDTDQAPAADDDDLPF